jgi:hypothetical protein
MRTPHEGVWGSEGIVACNLWQGMEVSGQQWEGLRYGQLPPAELYGLGIEPR